MIITVLHSHVSFYFIILSFLFFHGSDGATITIVNRCSFTVWPGILSNSGSGDIGTTGFELVPGGSRSFQAPASWSGRFWARTGCNFNSDTGQGTCLTGDCGSNQVECNGAGAKPPATLAEFTIGSGPADPARKQDFYDVSLVDGYNVPMLVEASGGSEGTCLTTGCVTDLNQKCPTELRFGSGSACKSACEAFGSPEYCCSGAYASPTECKPSMYSEIFKSACPRSYSYAFDDATTKNRQRMGGEMAVDQYKPHRHHYRRGCPMSSPLIPQMFSLPNIYSSLLFFFFCIFDIFVSHFRVYIFYPITFLCFMIMIMHIDEHLI
ncbi:THAUMATIN-LIKE PROTEIN 1 [Arabidopsis thaliana]|uniref:THAUMATIN-LIKE PROTEIN 1 n=1 Tax=Arabidopsis thaliana TaxID=3702 RepID=A0A1P8B549_ARATH|nr:THAUMATIN-LIKE PROTEIN 1 [Arabidopsis thaliana]ANM66719.1 THAUMATIN-LIKE PROTEIN 1 [Arabidopsis thaliana]|eukprot:NP_001328598.1 THAUMATIN-LIKE PROTEIN 1 [Arabidopsis thaliana]